MLHKGEISLVAWDGKNEKFVWSYKPENLSGYYDSVEEQTAFLESKYASFVARSKPWGCEVQVDLFPPRYIDKMMFPVDFPESHKKTEERIAVSLRHPNWFYSMNEYKAVEKYSNEILGQWPKTLAPIHIFVYQSVAFENRSLEERNELLNNWIGSCYAHQYGGSYTRYSTEIVKFFGLGTLHLEHYSISKSGYRDKVADNNVRSIQICFDCKLEYARQGAAITWAELSRAISYVKTEQVSGEDIVGIEIGRIAEDYDSLYPLSLADHFSMCKNMFRLGRHNALKLVWNEFPEFTGQIAHLATYLLTTLLKNYTLKTNDGLCVDGGTVKYSDDFERYYDISKKPGVSSQVGYSEYILPLHFPFAVRRGGKSCRLLFQRQVHYPPN